jgi:hypothetical protein
MQPVLKGSSFWSKFIPVLGMDGSDLGIKSLKTRVEPVAVKIFLVTVE